MTQENGIETVTNHSGETFELKPGVGILTNKLIFELGDLLDQCPPEIQRVIKLYHAGNYLIAYGEVKIGQALVDEAISEAN